MPYTTETRTADMDTYVIYGREYDDVINARQFRLRKEAQEFFERVYDSRDYYMMRVTSALEVEAVPEEVRAVLDALDAASETLGQMSVDTHLTVGGYRIKIDHNSPSLEPVRYMAVKE